MRAGCIFLCAFISFVQHGPCGDAKYLYDAKVIEIGCLAPQPAEQRPQQAAHRKQSKQAARLSSAPFRNFFGRASLRAFPHPRVSCAHDARAYPIMLRATSSDASYLQAMAASRQERDGSNGVVGAATGLETMVKRCEISSANIDVTDVDGPDGVEYNAPRGLQYSDSNYWKVGSKATQEADATADVSNAIQETLKKLQSLTQNVARLEARLNQSEASNAALEERLADALAARIAPSNPATSPVKEGASSNSKMPSVLSSRGSPPARPMSAKPGRKGLESPI